MANIRMELDDYEDALVSQFKLDNRFSSKEKAIKKLIRETLKYKWIKEKNDIS